MRIRTAALVAATPLLLLPLGSGPAQAQQAQAARPAPARFSGAQYDSPGSDRGGNRSLNAEWVRITNHGHRARSLTGWTVRDTSGHVYRFGQERLRPGTSVRVHTGRGHNTARDRYMGESWYVWNNSGDTATLKNKRGMVVDRCHWGDGSGYTSC